MSPKLYRLLSVITIGAGLLAIFSWSKSHLINQQASIEQVEQFNSLEIRLKQLERRMGTLVEVLLNV